LTIGAVPGNQTPSAFRRPDRSLMTAVKRLRHLLEYIAFLIVAKAARALPLEIASRWSGASWRLVAPRLRRHRRAVRNLTLAYPDKSPAEIRAIALGMWENLGRTFAEFFHLDKIVNTDRVEIEDPEFYESLRARSGVVACSLHMANWEIVSQVGLPLGWRPAGVYQKIANPFVERYVNAIRAPLYPGGLMEKSSLAARALLRYAREGGCTALLADQRDSRGIPVPFFGRPANSTLFPALVARSLNAPLYIFRIKRLEGARFSVRIVEIPVPRTADKDNDLKTATRSLQASLELLIREAPEQWMWAQRRWD
jgi:KDO2-lipid IV(A) lauroyltransferase